MLRIALFDLDDTLYASRTGLWDAIGERINLFMTERLGLTPQEAAARRRGYLDAFGTTLNGLRHDFGIDPEDYLAFVHDLPLDQYLQRDPALNAMLARLPLTKVIFTNADAAHALRVTERLGVARHFQQIIDIRALDFVNKPEPGAYARACEILSARPAECLFADDARRNLLPARASGMLTVLVGGAGGPSALDGVDYWIPDILGLERIVAGLMGQNA
jgi:putative hydrolase of the HAD superfamily